MAAHSRRMQTITEHTMKTTSIGITKWAGNMDIEMVAAAGEGDNKVIAWRRDDGVVALETNGDPVFGDAADDWVTSIASADSAMPSADIITQDQANRIARLALDGDPHYSHEAIGADDGDINDMESETGGRRIIRADNDSEVAVYERADGSIVIVADANGPIAITAL